MNQPITRLFAVVVILFTVLIVWTTRWTVFESKALQDNSLNVRTLIDELKIKRGRILADNGTVLAKSVKGPGHTWDRTYPTGSLFAQAVGYSNLRQGQASGLELSRGRELRGIQTGLSSVFGQLGGSTQVGDDVYTTLDPTAQKLAQSQLNGQAGSVVALDPRTGAIKVMYSNPGYNNNNPPPKGPGTTFDRALQANYPPGSTFKVVTAAAALDSGKYTPQSTINGNSPVTISGVPLQNDLNQSFGPVTLTYALTQSINTVFAQVGVALGRQTMTEYMKRFGFYAKPPLDFPPDQMDASGEKLVGPHGTKLLLPTSQKVDIGRMSIGQDKLAVTPMQMAMVAAAVANHGTLMAPHLTNRVVNQDGQTVETIKPQVYSHVMKPSTAAALAKMMTNVVDEGTGQSARLEGLTVAGKTGTASISPPGSTEPWFICFAPVDNPKIAVAVTIERTPGYFGGQVAAPIAANIIKQLLSSGS